KTEGQKQAVKRVAPIETADQYALDQDADEGGQDRRQHQRAPEAEIGYQRVGEIAADRQEAAMGKIDHPRQVEDQRQSERHQRIERADDEAVDHVENKQLRHAAITITKPPSTLLL